MIESENMHLMFRKWFDDKTQLLLRGNFREASFAMTGSISSLSDEECILSSHKGNTKLAFRFDDPGCKFEYIERRAFIGSEAPDEFAERGHLLIYFPPKFTLEEFKTETTKGRDSLTISELHPSEIRDSD